MGFPAIKKDKYSYADYLTWDDGIRREIIDGVVYEMKFDSEFLIDFSKHPIRATILVVACDYFIART